MDTESTGDAELMVTLPPSLYEWLDERAVTLGIEREALLVQLLETHRTAAEFDEDAPGSLFDSMRSGEKTLGATLEASVSNAADGREERVPDDLESRFEAIDGRLDDITRRVDDATDGVDTVDGRVDDIDAKLTNYVEDLRGRVLQLRDAIQERAPAEHTHEEFDAQSSRIEALSNELETVSGTLTDVEEALDAITDAVDPADGRIDTIEHKLDRVAHALVAQKRRQKADREASTRLDALRREANRLGTTKADCGNCRGSVRIGLLSQPRCPHCDHRLIDLKAPESLLRLVKSPTFLVDSASAESKPSDESKASEEPDE